MRIRGERNKTVSVKVAFWLLAALSVGRQYAKVVARSIWGRSMKRFLAAS